MSDRVNTNMHLKNAYLELPSSFSIRWWFLQVPAPHQHWSTLIISLFAQPKTLLELITPKIGTKIAFHVCTVPMEVQITGALWNWGKTLFWENIEVPTSPSCCISSIIYQTECYPFSVEMPNFSDTFLKVQIQLVEQTSDSLSVDITQSDSDGNRVLLWPFQKARSLWPSVISHTN